ncbi:MAG: tkt [Rickettsiales bacterium]|jgi:transketolase|nr:tkt [Rickettsiales bacterium]
MLEKRALTLAATHQEMANAIRALSMDAVQKANSGHPGMPMGMADVATVLFRDFLKFDPKHPHWPDRDRFILSAGHGSMLLYALLYLTGYEDISLDDIKNFRQLGAKTAGHPEYGHAEGIETTTGPLGQGLANAVGFAIAEQLLAARFGAKTVDHHTYVIAGDGCLMEGISQEAISLAGHLKLGKLIVLWDDNLISIDGPTSLSTSDDQKKRFEASGWDVQAVNGHDADAVSHAIAKARETNTPSLIACRTTIGYGAPTKAGSSSSHGSPLGKDEIEGARKNLGWAHAPFEIPPHILSSWREVGNNGASAYKAWNSAASTLPNKSEFDRLMKGDLPASFTQTIDAFKQQMSTEKPAWATRKSSGKVLEALVPVVPELIGGSADLTGSNLTKTGTQKPVTAQDFSGNYLYYGIREHGMAAAMNGMALHGGVIPYGGTFLVFTDYCRPSIRLSALMGKRVIYVMTHDSIGLGEDGPTHQPVEHMAALRVIPNLYTFRPADAVETAECWQIALESTSTPSVLALTRQEVPTLRTEHTKENLCRKGAYILAEAAGGKVDVTIFATGSEVMLAIEAKARLEAEKLGVRVISVPSTELFDAQEKDYKLNLLCNDSIKVAVEAASVQGWEKYIGPHGIFVGMQGFGASGPAEELYKHFGITTDAIVERVKAKHATK